MHNEIKDVMVKAAIGILISIVCIVWVTGFLSFGKQPIYKTWFEIGEPGEYYCTVDDLKQKIIQRFEAPCDEVFEKVAVQIGTFSGSSRSQWKVELFEDDTDELLYERTFDAKKVKDNAYFNIINEKVEVHKDLSYRLVITPLKIQGETGLAFYGNEKGKRGSLTGGDSEEKFDLVMKVYGSAGEDWFWAGIYITVSFFAVLILLRIWRLHKRQVPWMQDLLVQTMVLMLVYYFLNQGALNSGEFMDENDNIRGGMIAANGGVIYKDYVTQHMPFMYYLCAVFAKLGAGSLPQFRILYDMFCAMFAGLIYLRNGEKFGKCRIALFLIWEPFVLYMNHSDYCLRILSDNIQAMAMDVLLLEYLNYRKKPGVGIRRSIVVSIAIFISLGCVFLSVYPIAVIGAGVIINEASHVKKKRRRRRPFSYYVKRYRKLVLTCLFPFGLWAVYFAVSGTLPLVYDMAYRFNIEVYQKYSGIGGSKLGPLFMGIGNFFFSIINNMPGIAEEFTKEYAVRLLLLLTVAVCIGKELRKRNDLTGITIFLFLCMCYTRGEDSCNFHAVTFWSVALLIAILLTDITHSKRLIGIWRQAASAAAILAVSFLIYQPYGSILWDNIFSEHAVELKEWEQYVVDHTEKDDVILVDSASFESIYLMYRGRYSVSRVPYFLPWYMDWYQDEIIKEIQEHKPDLILYNPDMKVWGIDGFLEPMREQVEKDYVMEKRTGGYYRK